MALYKKSDSPFWWTDIRVAGRRHRISTKQKSKTHAAQIEAALIHQLSTGESTWGIRKSAPILRGFAEDFFTYIEASQLKDGSKQYYRDGWKLLKTKG